MRTKTWLWALSAAAFPAALIACGDDSNTGGNGGGATTSTTSPTTSVTSSKSASATSSSSKSSTGVGDVSSSSTGTPITGAENCPADPAFVVPRDSEDNPGDHAVVIHDSTTGKSNDLTEFCAADSTAGDVVYQFQIQDSCVFNINLQEDAGFDGVFSFRETCDTRLGNYDCENKNTSGEQYTTFLDPGTYYVVVDGTAGSEGDFTLTLDCAVSVCGDGIVGPEEQCDGGPTANPNDGCGDPTPPTALSCKFETTASADSCTGVGTIAVPSGTSYSAPAPAPPYSNVGALDDFQGTTTCDLLAGGLDRVFQIQPAVSGDLVVTIGEDTSGANMCEASPSACWNSVLYVRSGACTPGANDAAELGCNYDIDGSPEGSVFSVDVGQVVAGNVYTVVVDSYEADPTFNTGPFYLKFDLTP